MSTVDRWVRPTFWLLGVGILLPWNAFISAKPYFDARMCSGNGQSRGNIELWFGFVYNLSSVISLGGLILWQLRRDKPLTPSTARPTREARDVDDSRQSWWMVMLPLYIYLAVFLQTTAVVTATSLSTSLFLGFTLLSLCTCGICTAFASAGIVATAGLFPSETGTHPYFSGQALGGLAVAISNLIAASLRDPKSFLAERCGADRRQLTEEAGEGSCTPYNTVDWSSFSYFLVGSIVLGACAAGYRHVDSCKREMLRAQYETLEGELVDDDSEEQRKLERPIERHGSIEMYIHEDVVDAVHPRDTSIRSTVGPTVEHPLLFVWHAVRGPAVSIFLTFMVTLALFPGWTSELQSAHECQTHRRYQNDLYTPITFVTFNAGDFIGRLLSARFIRNHPTQTLSRTLVVVSLCRVAFFPLFLLCLARDSLFYHASVHSDLFSLAVQASFAILNGIVVSTSFSHAPTLVPPTQEMQTKASEMLNFALSFGLLCGSILSFPFSKVATGHW